MYLYWRSAELFSVSFVVSRIRRIPPPDRLCELVARSCSITLNLAWTNHRRDNLTTPRVLPFHIRYVSYTISATLFRKFHRPQYWGQISRIKELMFVKVHVANSWVAARGDQENPTNEVPQEPNVG